MLQDFRLNYESAFSFLLHAFPSLQPSLYNSHRQTRVQFEEFSLRWDKKKEVEGTRNEKEEEEQEEYLLVREKRKMERSLCEAN